MGETHGSFPPELRISKRFRIPEGDSISVATGETRGRNEWMYPL